MYFRQAKAEQISSNRYSSNDVFQMKEIYLIKIWSCRKKLRIKQNEIHG